MARTTKRNRMTRGETGNSYREVLQRWEPEVVDERFTGGAFGCPGEYFRGAPLASCRSDLLRRCEDCWSRPYEDEEWIPYEKRDE